MGDYAKQRATIYGVLGVFFLLAGVGVTVGTYELAKKSGGKGKRGCNNLPALQAFPVREKLFPVSGRARNRASANKRKFFGALALFLALPDETGNSFSLAGNAY